MSLEDFIHVIKKRLQEKCKGTCQVKIRPIEKNNQVIRIGIGISRKTEKTMTMVTLAPYYQQYMYGNIGLEEIVEDICRVIGINAGGGEDMDEKLYDYSEIKEKIIFRLIGREWNRRRLENIPHLPFLDMEIEFRMVLERNGWGQKELLIDNKLCKHWPVDAQGLFQQALKNTMRLCPGSIRTMQEVMMDIAEKYLEDEIEEQILREIWQEEQEENPMYVLSNEQGIYGAGVLLYPGVIRDFAESQGSDLIILPSSVHEVLAIPYKEEIGISNLKGMVMNINRSEVPPEDQLSDQVYLYRRELGEIVVAE